MTKTNKLCKYCCCFATLLLDIIIITVEVLAKIIHSNITAKNNWHNDKNKPNISSLRAWQENQDKTDCVYKQHNTPKESAEE